jgi:hypothetical protein
VAVDSGPLGRRLPVRMRFGPGFRLLGPSLISDARSIDRGGCPRNEHIDERTHLRWQ